MRCITNVDANLPRLTMRQTLSWPNSSSRDSTPCWASWAVRSTTSVRLGQKLPADKALQADW